MMLPFEWVILDADMGRAICCPSEWVADHLLAQPTETIKVKIHAKYLR